MFGVRTDLTPYQSGAQKIDAMASAQHRVQVEAIGRVVRYVTQHPVQFHTPYPCLSAVLGGAPCDARVNAYLEWSTMAIHWQCCGCGGYGDIVHWERTPWDCFHREPIDLCPGGMI